MSDQTYSVADRFHELPVWAQLWLLVLVLGAVAAVVVLGTRPKPESAEYKRVRAECTAAADAKPDYTGGNDHQAWVDSVNSCLVANYKP